MLLMYYNYGIELTTNERDGLPISEVAKRGLTCGVLPKTTGTTFMKVGHGGFEVTQEVMRVVVAGGYIVPELWWRNDKVGQPSVHVFSLVVNSWEFNGETHTVSNGIWTEGGIAMRSFHVVVETVLSPLSSEQPA